MPARPNTTSEAPCRFLFLAAICRRKGIDVLIQAARQLRERGIGFRLTIAGPEERPGQADQLADGIRANRLEACVEFVGTVTGSAKDDLLRQCDCLVLPSRAEGLPLTLLEAGAGGMPVLATTVGAIPEVISGTRFGRLVPPEDATALSAAMADLAADGSLRTALGEALAHRIAQHYSLQNQSSLLADLYEALLTERAAVTTAPQGDLIRIAGEDSLGRPAVVNPTPPPIRPAHNVSP
ncbi:MAG: glycosyltransferase family 4 protein [bacterium]|nr:glycosyltransferase family 4 protein [bacterium]